MYLSSQTTTVRILRFIFFLLLSSGLIVGLSVGLDGNPAFGTLLNPFSGFWNNAESKQLHLAEELPVEGLKDSVSIYFDEMRIPHIFAQNDHDLYYAQGFVTASLRLWQMEFQVLAAEGRLSEIIGPKTLGMDMESRRKGLKFGAEQKVKEIEKDPQAKLWMDAYSAGVNAYVASLDQKDLPLEYKLLQYKPEKWSGYKTALLLMNMSNMLTNTEYDIEQTNFIQTYGQGLFDTLFQESYPEIEPIFSTPNEGWEEGLKSITSKTETDLLEVQESTVSLDPLGIKPNVQIGSNNWVLSGKKTTSGYPLLANDPHLALTFPSIWLEMHLHTPESNTYGVALPGAPAIIIGFNDHIGWGVTNAGRDVKDWYTVEYKDQHKDFYQFGLGWRETTKVIETYKVKGENPVYDTIIHTHLGPVAKENLQTKNGTVNLALQWTAHLSGQEYMTFHLLNKAKNYADYLDALSYYNCPAQNFIFAATNGDIALRQQGKFPVLYDQEGRTIKNAASHETWDQFIPFESIPTALNPKKGFLSSANQQVADTTYPYYFNGVFEYHRNRVINEELRRMKKAEVADMKELQYNNFNLLAGEIVPLLLSQVNYEDVNGSTAKSLFMALDEWDYYMTEDSKTAIWFQLFYDNFYTSLWDELVEENTANSWANYYYKNGLYAPNDYQTMQLIKDSIQHPFIDNLTTPKKDNITDIVLLAFEKTAPSIDSLEAKSWGEFKGTRILHLTTMEAFSTTVSTGGGYKMVNASGRLHGPSWRMILDFSEGEVKGIGVYPGGQSGNPGSPFYDNMVEDWRTGNYHTLNNSNSEASYATNAFKRVILKPL